MAHTITTQEEAIILKKAFFRLLKNICVERRKYLYYEIKIVSSATKISKEDLVNFEKGNLELSKDKLLLLLKFYAISLEVVLNYLEKLKDNPERKKELKTNNKNLNDNQTEELSKLVGFKGFKK